MGVFITLAFTFAGLYFMLKWLDKNKETEGHIAKKINDKGWFLAVALILIVLFIIANGF